VTLQLMLIWPIDSLGFIIASGQEAMTAADRIFEVLDTTPSIADRPAATPLVTADVHGAVRFEGVQFTYPGAPRPVLRGVDLEVHPGETLAIVGATGSGKTTLVSLVPRLIEPTAGRITVDGRDIGEVTIDSLRSVVGVASRRRPCSR
jgi:ATP-binding cassette subfamily B protein